MRNKQDGSRRTCQNLLRKRRNLDRVLAQDAALRINALQSGLQKILIMRVTTASATVAVNKGLFAWVSDLGSQERRAFGACVGGWALDAMDVQMYSFVIPALIATWGITRGQ